MRANGFKTFIVSGGGIEFMRPWTEKTYGIPPEQVVGSSAMTKFQMRPDGMPVLLRERKIEFVDDKAGKAGGHQPLHRPAAGLRVRKFRRRPGDAGMDRGRKRRPLHGPRPSHRRRARMGL